MQIQINDIRRTDTRVYYEMTSGRYTMVVSYIHSGVLVGRVETLVANASHLAWRGYGKVNESWDDALKAYKSGACKAMIEHVRKCETEAGALTDATVTA